MRVLQKNWQFLVLALGLGLTALFYSLPEVYDRLPDAQLWEIYQQARAAGEERRYEDAVGLLENHVEDLGRRWIESPLYFYASALRNAYPNDPARRFEMRQVVEKIYNFIVNETPEGVSVLCRPDGEEEVQGPRRQFLTESQAKQVILWLAELADDSGDLEGYVRYMTTLADLFPATEYARHLEIAERLRGEGVRRADRALMHLTKYLDSLAEYGTPEEIESAGYFAAVYRGRILKDAGRWDEANAAFGAVIDKYPDRAGIEEVYLYLGDIARAEKRRHDALVLYDRATSYPVVNTFTQIAQFRKAELLQDAERYPEAYAAFERLLSSEMDPRVYFAARLRQGDIAYLDGSQPRSVELYEDALRRLGGNAGLFDPSLIDKAAFFDRLINAVAESKLNDFATFEKGIRAVRMFCDAHDSYEGRQYRQRLALLYAEYGERLGRSRRPGDATSHASEEMFLAASDEFARVLKSMEISPAYTQSLWNAALFAYRGRYYAGALRWFQEYRDGMAEDATDSEADLYIARCRRQLGDFEGAIDLYAKINRDHPYRLQAYQALLELAKTYQDAYQYEMAATFYQRIFKDYYDYNTGEIRRSRISPDSAVWREAEFSLGQLYFLRGMYRDAEDSLKRAIERYAEPSPENDRPDLHKARYYLACTYFLNGKYREAIPLFAAIAGLNADAAGGEVEDWQLKSSFRLGDCYYRLDLNDQAVAAYESAINKYSREVEAVWAHYQIGNIKYRANLKQEAARSYDRALFLFDNLDEAQFGDLPAGLDKAYWQELFSWVKSVRK